MSVKVPLSKVYRRAQGCPYKEAIISNTMVNISFTGNSSNNLDKSTSVHLSTTESVEFKFFKLFFYAVIFLISVIGNTLVCTVIVKRH